MFKKIVVGLAIVFMGACSTHIEFLPNDQLVNGGVIRSVGLGAEPNNDTQSDDQHQLLAIKASKMDAYRSLIEKVYGVHVSSSVTVRSLSIENDTFKGKVEGLIQMAEVVEVRPIGGGSYETIMEVKLTPEFRQFVLTEFAKRN
jgi:hypothetical protein